MRQVVEDEPADDGIEARVVERQLLGVGPAEVELGLARPRKLEHAVGDVDADRIRAPRRRPFGHVAGSCRDVEHAHVVPHPGGVSNGSAIRAVIAPSWFP